LTRFSFGRTDQWAGSNALQQSPFASVSDYMTLLTCALTNDQWAHPACLFFSSSKSQPGQLSSFQFSYITLYTCAFSILLTHFTVRQKKFKKLLAIC